MVIRFLLAVLLLEACIVGGVATARYTLDLREQVIYYALYHQEKVERLYWQSKVECARKLNGCDKMAVEKRIVAQ